MSQVRRFPLLISTDVRTSNSDFFLNFRRGWEGEGTSEEGGGNSVQLVSVRSFFRVRPGTSNEAPARYPGGDK